MKRLTEYAALRIFLLSMVALPTWNQSGQAQDFYGFEQVLTGEIESNRNTNIKPTRLEAGIRGGVIQLRMPDSAGTCFGDYEFRWEFQDDIRRIEPGKEYRLRMTGRRVGGQCDRNTNTAWMSSSNMGSRLAKARGLQNTANNLQLTKSSANVVAWPVATNNSVDAVIKTTSSRIDDRTQFKFQFDFSSHPYSSVSKSCKFEVAYLYKKNHTATSTTQTNCQNLYGLGFNIGILEYGSLQDAKPSFLVKFVDEAILHAKASGCIPAEELGYLSGLKTRLTQATTSRQFAEEISAFRQKVARIIEPGC